MANFYCEYCGEKFSDVRTLTANSCFQHPLGAGKGNHKLYEGTEKSTYTCKYCGEKYSDVRTLTANSCYRHPNGVNKGKHAPAL